MSRTAYHGDVSLDEAVVEIAVRKGNEITFVRSLPIGVTMDERICSGSYFASAFKALKKYLTNPQLLEVPPEKVVEDEG